MSEFSYRLPRHRGQLFSQNIALPPCKVIVNPLLLDPLKQESITSPFLLCFIRVVFGMGQPLMAVAFRFIVLLFMGASHQVFQFVGRIAEIFGF